VVVLQQFDAVDRGKGEQDASATPRRIGSSTALELAVQDRDQKVAVPGCGSRKVLSTKSGPVSSSSRTRSSILSTMCRGVKTSP
jgi:hypothetical protein